MGKAVFGLGVFITGVSVVLLPFLPTDSAEFVVTVLSALMGGLTMLLVAVFAFIARR
jgi:hypothetical protein